MLMASRVAGRTLGIRGLDLTRGPEVVNANNWYRICLHLDFDRGQVTVSTTFCLYNYDSHSTNYYVL